MGPDEIRQILDAGRAQASSGKPQDLEAGIAALKTIQNENLEACVLLEAAYALSITQVLNRDQQSARYQDYLALGKAYMGHQQYQYAKNVFEKMTGLQLHPYSDKNMQNLYRLAPYQQAVYQLAQLLFLGVGGIAADPVRAHNILNKISDSGFDQSVFCLQLFIGVQIEEKMTEYQVRAFNRIPDPIKNQVKAELVRCQPEIADEFDAMVRTAKEVVAELDSKKSQASLENKMQQHSWFHKKAPQGEKTPLLAAAGSRLKSTPFKKDTH